MAAIIGGSSLIASVYLNDCYKAFRFMKIESYMNMSNIGVNGESGPMQNIINSMS
ncbi:hypothetical protein SAMN04515619_11960 [Collimonas sp. OK412]|jgi:hypothetical protein|nr:hypothetical protein SAMN04515619_11960 [Collimonas sp. OK412]